MPETLNSALQAPTPDTIRDELADMILKDLLGPAGGAEEKLDPREDRVYGRYLVGMLAPVSARVEAEEQDSLQIAEQDDGEVGPSEAATTPVETFFPNSMGLSFLVEKGTKA